MLSFRTLMAGATAAAVLTLAALPAHAKCTRLGFSVNDYGKEGPTNDAKKLLDGYIAKWASENGIAKYKTGTKTVKCDLFLDFVVFDEHTCRAEADVCWDEKQPGAKPVTAAAGKVGAAEASNDAAEKAAKAAAKRLAEPAKAAAEKAADAPAAKAEVAKPAPEKAAVAKPAVEKPAATPVAAPAAPAKPAAPIEVKAPAAPAPAKPAAAPVEAKAPAGAAITTGTLPKPAAAPAAKVAPAAPAAPAAKVEAPAQAKPAQ